MCCMYSSLLGIVLAAGFHPTLCNNAQHPVYKKDEEIENTIQRTDLNSHFQ